MGASGISSSILVYQSHHDYKTPGAAISDQSQDSCMQQSGLLRLWLRSDTITDRGSKIEVDPRPRSRNDRSFYNFRLPPNLAVGVGCSWPPLRVPQYGPINDGHTLVPLRCTFPFPFASSATLPPLDISDYPSQSEKQQAASARRASRGQSCRQTPCFCVFTYLTYSYRACNRACLVFFPTTHSFTAVTATPWTFFNSPRKPSSIFLILL